MVVGEGLIKSKERVQKHGEVFTPPWMVEKMLAEPGIQVKLQDLHATFLEPSAGEGAFLTEILRQKLLWVNQMTPPVVHELEQLTRWKRNTLWALMSIYGIEYLADNLAKARENMLAVFCENYQQQRKRKLGRESELYRSARLVIAGAPAAATSASSASSPYMLSCLARTALRIMIRAISPANTPKTTQIVLSITVTSAVLHLSRMKPS